MKKSLVAVGIIVALGVVWTGGSWYTGKQLEGRLTDMVAQANAQLASTAPEAGIQLAYQNYQRGVFSSHLQMVVKPVDGAKSSWLKPGQTIVLDENVSHGPFPLASLKTFNLAPAMATVESKLVNNEASKQLFELAKGQSPFDISTRISYAGDTRSDISLKPLNYEKGEEKVAFSGGEFQLDADRDGNAFALNGDMESGVINAVNEYNQKVQVTFNNLKTSGDSKLTSFAERIGNQKVTLDKMAISVEGKELALLDGMTIDGKSNLSKDGKTIDATLDYALNSLKLQGQDMGSSKLALKIGQIDGQAWHQFSQQYNGQVQALLAQPGVMDNPEVYQQKVTEAFFGALPLLLKGEPVITVAPLSWKNSKGETTFNLSLFLKDPSQATIAPQTLAQEVDRSVKSLDSKLVIPMDMATEFMTQVARLEGYQQADAEKLASQQVKGLAAMGQMFRITTQQDNNIQSSLQYSNGQVSLNGKKMPLADFVGMFGVPDVAIPAPQSDAPSTAPQGQVVPAPEDAAPAIAPN
ncbi:YdgA family protein [Scandinavium sp. TWS1a]|uniref:YdgA family protein n=1 Tax=Scandinavium tedordense TaxID=2926521 RepID=UPI001359938A|nr:YdgA family protein [Scandinavium tedordense]MCS2171294.1 YdgA family protein [Scandinavium tedordense]